MLDALLVGHNGHMKKLTVATLKDGLSRHLQYVESGGTIVVYRRDKPIAEIRPLAADVGEMSDEDRLASLERRGIITRGDPSKLADLKTAEVGNSGVLEALLEERRTGR